MKRTSQNFPGDLHLTTSVPILPPCGMFYSGQLETHNQSNLLCCSGIHLSRLCWGALCNWFELQIQINMQIVHSSICCTQSNFQSEQSLWVFYFLTHIAKLHTRGYCLVSILVFWLKRINILLTAKCLIIKIIHVCWAYLSGIRRFCQISGCIQCFKVILLVIIITFVSQNYICQTVTFSGVGWSSLHPVCAAELQARTAEGEFWLDEAEFTSQFDDITVGYPIGKDGHLKSIYTGYTFIWFN